MAHNAAWSDYAAGFREVVFVCPESTYGVIVHPNEDGSEAISFLTCSFEFKQERINRADKTSTRSYSERISHRMETAWSLNLYVLPNGAVGTAPDIDAALVAAFGRKATLGTAHAEAGCTTTTLNVTNGEPTSAAWEVGGAIQWINAAGDAEVSFITSIVTTGSPDVVIVSPPFSGSPQAGDSLYGSVSYFLADTLSTLCFTRILDNVVDVWSGCFVNDVAFDFPGTGEGTLTLGGAGKGSYLSGTSLLGSPITNVATALYVPRNHGRRFDANTRIQVDSEVLLVTAVALDQVPATTGTVTAAAASGGSLADATYHFAVAVVDYDGNIGIGSANASATTSGSNNTVNLSWTAIPGAYAYRVYEGSSANSYTKYRDLAAVASPSLAVTTLATGWTTMSAADAPLVNAAYMDKLTVTRAQAGTSAAAHTVSTALGPYQPTRVVAGSPVSSCLGDFIIVQAGVTRANATIKTQAMGLTMNNQGALRNTQYGTCSAIGFKVMRRDVGFTATLWLEPAQAAVYNKAKAFVGQQLVHQHGKVSGKIIAWRMPTAEFVIPKIDGNGDDDVNVPISGIGLSSVTGNDELVIAFC